MALHMASFMLVGEDIGPTNDAERIYTTAVLIMGQIITAVVIGNIGIVLNNQQSLTALYQNKMDRVNESMTTLNLPEEIQDKVRMYYDYLWLRHRVFQPTEITFRDDLNKSIRAEVELFLNARLVSSNPLFEDMNDAIVVDIVVRFQTIVFLSKDYIIRMGEWGDSMFFIAAGSACAKIGDQIVAEYGKGDSFGESKSGADLGEEKSNEEIKGRLTETTSHAPVALLLLKRAPQSALPQTVAEGMPM